MTLKRMHTNRREAHKTAAQGAVVYRFPIVTPLARTQASDCGTVYWSRTAKVEPYPFDEPYLARLRTHDPETEGHFVHYFNALLKAKLRSAGYSESSMGDIRQETLYRVLRAIYDNKVQTPKSLRSFVYGVSERVEWEYDRGEWRQWQEDHEDFPEVLDDRNPADGPAHQAEMRQTIGWVLARLPEKERKILVALFLEEKDKDQICSDFGINRAYLRVLVHRALLSAKKLLSKGAAS
jgi:RNA polymerase sigma-70 factor, ECF subfamily